MEDGNGMSDGKGVKRRGVRGRGKKGKVKMKVLFDVQDVFIKDRLRL